MCQVDTHGWTMPTTFDGSDFSLDDALGIAPLAPKIAPAPSDLPAVAKKRVITPADEDFLPAPKSADADAIVRFGWTRHFVYELAMQLGTPEDICASHGVSPEQWERLKQTPAFVADLERAAAEVKNAGVAFRVKAEIMSEKFLETTFSMMQENHAVVPPAVKRNLFRDIVRAAGLDASVDKEAEARNASVPALTVNINI